MLLKAHYDEIIIGSSLGALSYAFRHGLPVFFTTPRRPHRFEYFNAPKIIDDLRITHEENKLTTPNGEVYRGQKKVFLWEKLAFTLNLSGLCPLNGSATNLRIENNNLLKAYNDFSLISSIEFDKATIFDENLNIETRKIEPPRYVVLDWFSAHSGGKHNIDLIQTEDEFVKEIWFYESDRVHSGIKDICAISYLTEDQVDEFEFSDTYARFKTQKIMELNGMKGASNGIDPATGKNKHYAIKISNVSRDKVPVPVITYAPTKTIKMNIDSEEDLLSNLRTNSDKIRGVLEKLCT
jgi:hypothetical protein